MPNNSEPLYPSMKRYIIVALFAAVFAASVGVLTATGVSAIPFMIAGSDQKTLSDNSAGIMGHITLTVFDENGNIKAYRQTDNLVVNNGEDCAVVKVFGGEGGGGETCSATLGTAFNFIGIGTSATAVTSGQTALVAASGSRVQDLQPDFTAAAGATNGGKAKLISSFTGFTATIEEAGLFDASTTGNMFARQLTGSTVLTSSDTLQIEWTIELKGSTDA